MHAMICQMALRFGQQQMYKMHFCSCVMLPTENHWHSILLNNAHQAYGAIHYDRECLIIHANALLMSAAPTDHHWGHLLWRGLGYIFILLSGAMNDEWWIKTFHHIRIFTVAVQEQMYLYGISLNHCNHNNQPNLGCSVGCCAYCDWTIWRKYLTAIFLINFVIAIKISIIFYKLKYRYVFVVCIVLNNLHLYPALSQMYFVSTGKESDNTKQRKVHF